jgi:hypothetical protein
LPLFFNFALEYAIRKIKENQVGLQLNDTQQLLVYADDVDLLGYNINSTKTNTDALNDTSKEVGPEANKVKTTKYMMMSCHQNAGQNHNIKTAN